MMNKSQHREKESASFEKNLNKNIDTEIEGREEEEETLTTPPLLHLVLTEQMAI